MVFKICNENWNTSNLAALRLISANVVLFHSRGLGSPYDTTTPSFMTNSRSSIDRAFIWGIIYFRILSGSRVAAQNLLQKNCLYDIAWPPVYDIKFTFIFWIKTTEKIGCVLHRNLEKPLFLTLSMSFVIDTYITVNGIWIFQGCWWPLQYIKELF